MKRCPRQRGRLWPFALLRPRREQSLPQPGRTCTFLPVAEGAVKREGSVLLTVLFLTQILAVTVNARDAPRTDGEITHVIVRKPPEGRGLMAPNNGGIWSWGNEILVMYVNGPHKNGTGCGSH